MADQALQPTPNDADVHLSRLYTSGLEEPWIKVFFRNLREAFSSDKKPPLVLTSKPIEVEGTDLQEAWIKVFFRDLKEAIRPKKLPPLVLTSKPVDDVQVADLQQPWLKTFVADMKELIHPKKLPPLEVTSQPVAVKDMWGFYGGHERTAGLTSILIHAGAIGLLFLIAMIPTVQKAVKTHETIVAPIDLAPYQPKLPPKSQTMGGGGGGGDRSPLPPSKGKLPRVAQRQFVPPTAVIQNQNPKLVMEPTIVAPDILPQVNMPNYGDPLAKLGPASNGPGSGGGIGTGSGGGVGSGHGQGFGPGSGGGVGGGVYRIGGGVSAPQLVFKVEPEYSEEARKAKFQGTVVLYVVVDAQGLPRDLKVVRPLGLGLDQKAIEAVQKWRFKPGQKDGHPVAVSAQIEVNFRLL
jgi:TonB family protein